MFGTDGVYSPSQYKPRLGYVSVFAVDLHFLKSAKKVVAEYNRFSKNKAFGAFGPPSYVAAWIEMSAIQKACADDTVTRAELVPLVQKSNTPSILGGSVQFDRRGDPTPTAFAIYKVTDGTYSRAG